MAIGQIKVELKEASFFDDIERECFKARPATGGEISLFAPGIDNEDGTRFSLNEVNQLADFFRRLAQTIRGYA